MLTGKEMEDLIKRVVDQVNVKFVEVDEQLAHIKEVVRNLKGDEKPSTRRKAPATKKETTDE